MKSPILAVSIFVIGLTAALTYANNQSPAISVENPLRGKVVIINPSSISKPRSEMRIEELGGKKFVVYPVTPANAKPYEAWTAVDEIASMRVFATTADAEAYLQRQVSR